MNHYTHLTVKERRCLHVFREMGLSIATIAKRLNRHRSTLYRELAKNQTQEAYLPMGPIKRLKQGFRKIGLVN